ncbi:MAG: S41 family peptidase [Chloroflexi bacterium]|nr:S41 family peptidase [Chloroflexota bacterium]
MAGLLAVLLVVAIVGCGGASSPTAVPAGANTDAPVLANGEIATPTALPAIPAPEDVPAGLEPIWEAYTILVREYVEREKIDPDKLAEGAIRGMVEALGDRHTAYISPETLRLQNSDLEGEFQGIGAEIQTAPDGKGIVIVAPLRGAPAEAAGLKPGDLILAVNGDRTEGWSVIDAVTKIRGPKGTPVTLKIRRLNSGEEVDITIVRGVIDQPSLAFRMLEEAPYGVIVLDQFTAKSAGEVRNALSKLKGQGAKGLVLDLRGNPGGLLTTTVDIASEFLEDGLVTYEVDGRANRRDWRVKPGGTAKDLPLVVLVDQGSASGSEVLAASLQQKCGHDRAVLIGQKTFGKGSVNTLRELSNGGGLYLTFARWYSPNGCLIEGGGITPDVLVALPRADRTNPNFEDTQMSAAIKQLNFQTGLTSASP